MILVDELAVGDELSCVAIGSCCRIDFSTLYTPNVRDGIIPSGSGSWLYPNGSYVRPSRFIYADSYGIERPTDLGEVNLRRRLSSGIAEGVWRCEVPTVQPGVNEIVHIGMYTTGQGR